MRLLILVSLLVIQDGQLKIMEKNNSLYLSKYTDVMNIVFSTKEVMVKYYPKICLYDGRCVNTELVYKFLEENAK